MNDGLIEYDVKWDMAIEMLNYDLYDVKWDMAIEMWCVWEWEMIECWWGICVIVRLSRADSLYWLWNLKLSRTDSSSSGHMRKRLNIRWVSWAERIATQ